MTVLALAGTCLLAAGVSYVKDAHPMSILDEHVHLDYAANVREGTIPHAGGVYTLTVREEWSCGVGHMVGGYASDCAGNLPPVEELPSGQYSSAYIHYPTYFVAANVFAGIAKSVFHVDSYLTGLRLFSVLCLALGMAAALAFALALGLRGWGAAASALIPVGAIAVLHHNFYVSPNATQTLTGVLVAGTALLWIRRNKGFTWVALATALAASIAVVDCLAVAAVALAATWQWGRNRWSTTRRATWRPALWQPVLLGVLVLAPIVAWNQVIVTRQTVPNDVIYARVSANAPLPERALNLASELTGLHSPWPYGWPLALDTWLTVAVIGLVLFKALGILKEKVWPLAKVDGADPLPGLDTRLAPAPRPRTGADVLRVVCVSAIAILVLYPPIQWISIYTSFGSTLPIVPRYSIGLAPLFTFAALLAVPRERARVALGGLGTAAVLILAALTMTGPLL
jgi:hypothetical protein